MRAMAAGVQEDQIAAMLLGIGVILLVGAGLGALARKVGQPKVIGEITAGIVLGPGYVIVASAGCGSSVWKRPA